MLDSWKAAVLAIVPLLLSNCPVSAQITPDSSLGTQVNGSTIAPCTGNCAITNGATRSSNLFHSFRQFSLPNGDVANFQIAPAIQNVIVRVTGVGQPFLSNINGTIQTSNPANLFLLNPNGIIFGSGARLNIGGSFLATTANRMLFQDGTQFNTSDPAPLLTVNVPIGLQFGSAPGSIQLRGTNLSAGNTDNFGDIALVGGNVTLDNARIFTPGRHVDLAGIATGIANLTLNENALSLNLSETTARADISLLNASQVGVDAERGGGISISSNNFYLSGGSLLINGISQNLGSDSGQVGDIVVNATGVVTADADSKIVNQVFRGKTGNSGNIQIQAKSISFSDSALLLATTFGNGNAGNVTLNAQNSVSFDGKTTNGGFQSGIYNTVEETGTGRAGNIEITTGNLSITRGAQLDSSVFGKGSGGNIAINARQSVIFDGISPDGFQSAAFSEILETGEGQGGKIQITADSLAVTNGAQLNTSTRNEGNAGDITINVRDQVLFSGGGLARTAVNKEAIGNGGDIQITAGSVVLSSGGSLNSLTAGTGKAGNVIINARDTVLVDRQNSVNDITGIDANLLEDAKGQGGNISISTGSLSLKNGATFQTVTNGEGNAGAITIDAREAVIVTGQDSFNGSSVLATVVAENGRGRAGDIRIAAHSILITDQGLLASLTLGQGDGGTINLNAKDRVLFDRGFAFSSSQSLTGGNAGNIDIQARQLELRDRSSIRATTQSSQGGNIVLTLKESLLMRRNSQISTSAGLAGAGGNGGNITINAPRGFLVAVPNENSDITANAFSGSGGNVRINAASIYQFTLLSRADLIQALNTTDSTQLDPSELLTNDITAISQDNPFLSGTVTLNSPDVDPNRGLVPLPTVPTDPSNQLDQSCVPNATVANSSFTVIGRGGLPSRPEDSSVANSTLPRLATISASPIQNRNSLRQVPSDRTVSISTSTPRIVEAQAALRLSNGKIRFFSQAPSGHMMNIIQC
jgi:filamentous hemagglutinin family protein